MRASPKLKAGEHARRAPLCTAAIAVGVAWPVAPPAQAQTSIDGSHSSADRIASPRQGVSVPATTVQAKREIGVSLYGSATYDDNATRSNSLRPPPADLRKHDVLFPVGANVDIALPEGRNTFTLNGFLGYEFNLHNTRLNTEVIGLTAGYDRVVLPCDISLDGGLHRQRGTLNQTDITAGSFTRNIQTIGNVGGTVTCGRPVGLRPFAQVDYERERNSQRLFSGSNNNTVTYGGGIVYTQPSIGDLGIVASIDDTRLIDRPANGSLGADRFKAKSIGVYFSRATARILQARVQLNYTRVDDPIPGRSFKGLSGEANVRFVPGGRVELELKASRAAVPALSYSADYQVETPVQATLSAGVSARLRLQASGGSLWRRYYGGLFNPVHPLVRERLTTARLQSSYALPPRASLFFGGSYTWRNANDRFYNYHDLRVTVGLNARL